MSKKSKWGFSTKSVHIGNKANEEHGSVAPPIHLTSTFKQDGVGQNRGHDYSRVSNPTRVPRGGGRISNVSAKLGVLEVLELKHRELQRRHPETARLFDSVDARRNSWGSTSG